VKRRPPSAISSRKKRGVFGPRVDRGLLVVIGLLCAAWEPLWRNQPDIADGIEAYQQKKWKEAQAHFEQAAKEIPDTP
jgi:hypothetical protein